MEEKNTKTNTKIKGSERVKTYSLSLSCNCGTLHVALGKDYTKKEIIEKVNFCLKKIGKDEYFWIKHKEGLFEEDYLLVFIKLEDIEKFLRKIIKQIYNSVSITINENKIIKISLKGGKYKEKWTLIPINQVKEEIKSKFSFVCS